MFSLISSLRTGPIQPPHTSHHYFTPPPHPPNPLHVPRASQQMLRQPRERLPPAVTRSGNGGGKVLFRLNNPLVFKMPLRVHFESFTLREKSLLSLFFF